MTRLRTIIATALLASVALITPAASHAAEADTSGRVAVAEAGDDLLVRDRGEQRISMLGWTWGG